MKSPNTRLGAVIAAGVAIGTISVLLGTRFINVAPPTSQQSGSNLPAGVCPLSTNSLPVGEATRMEAKLVLFDVASANDPNFPFRLTAVSTSARSQPATRVAQYFWVVAGQGNFHLSFPRPPQAGPTTGAFNYVVYYIPADSCDMQGGFAVQGLVTWPAWFDQMQAISVTTIK